MKVMVMLPTYNERDNIEDMVSEILKVDGVGIVIVDDDSPDGTGEIADRLASESLDRIHVIHRKERGRGTAGLAGFRYALAQDVDYIIEMDADFSHDPSDIPRFIEMAAEHDIVVGSRYAVGGEDCERTFIRWLISTTASAYTRLMLGSAFKDWSGGYKCYKKQALASLNFASFYSSGYAIGMETLYRLVRKGYSAIETPITFRERRQGYSKFTWHDVTAYLLTSLKLKWEDRSFFRKPLPSSSD